MTIVPPTAVADSARTLDATLPSGRFGASAVWDGSNVHVFGGQTGGDCSDGSCTNQILRFDPNTGFLSIVGATLPTGRKGTGAIWDGQNAYVFGGYDGDGLQQIVRYDPVTETVAVMDSILWDVHVFGSAIWDGSHAYLFGGWQDAGRIVRYHPATDTVTNMTARLPTPRVYTSAVWDGTNAYIFGGELCESGSCNEVQYDEVVRYHPGSDSIAVMNAKLPTPRYGTSAVWDGTAAYIFGGAACSLGTCNEGWSAYSQTLRYSPSADTMSEMDACLPSGSIFPVSAWTGQSAYLFGGVGLNQVVEYRPGSALPHDHCGEAPTSPSDSAPASSAPTMDASNASPSAPTDRPPPPGKVPGENTGEGSSRSGTVALVAIGAVSLAGLAWWALRPRR